MSLGVKLLIRVVALLVIIVTVVLTIVVFGTNTMIDNMIENRFEIAQYNVFSTLDKKCDDAFIRAQELTKFEDMRSAIESGDSAHLREVMQDHVGNLDYITVSDPDGIVLARSYNDTTGDSITNQEVITVAMQTGEGTSAIERGTKMPFAVRASATIKDEQGNVTSIVSCGYDLSKPEFVDGIKDQCQSEITIFLGDERFNTTIVDENGDRVVGTKASEDVINTVIGEGDEYKGEIDLFGTLFKVSYVPLVIDDETIGMVFTGVDAEEAHANQMDVLKIIIIASVLIMLLSIVIIFAEVNRIISKPLKRLTGFSVRLAGGDLSIKADDMVKRKDEIGSLTKNIMKIVESLNILENNIDNMKEWAVLGKITERMQEDDRVTGEFDQIIKSVNHVADVLVGHISMIPIPVIFVDTDYNTLFVNETALKILGEPLDQVVGRKCHQCWNSNGCGNEECPGRKAMESGSVRKSDLKVHDMEVMAYGMPFKDEEGNIAGFLEIMIDQTEINIAQRESERQAEATARQMKTSEKRVKYQECEIEKLMQALDSLANGNLKISVDQEPYDEDTKGIYDNFYKLASSLESSCNNIRGYIDELSNVLEMISQKDLNTNIDREYLGDFAEIKKSINDITGTLNEVFEEISVSAKQVQSESQQVASSAQSLAQGASEQISAVEEISATIAQISAQTKNNAENANKASKMSLTARDDAESGSRQMDEMVNAMQEIKEASKGIASIIKVIEDIAFQTNILALNAAVEAARAGEHGKGFAVVAEEVRTLAARSATAAKETTDMIDNSLARVEAGSKIAFDTAAALDKIVEGVTGTVDIVATIAQASVQQASAIEEVENGIEQISKVTQSNTKITEETASSSEEMAGQAKMLETMLDEFSLRGSKAIDHSDSKRLMAPPEQDDDNQL